MMIERKKLLGHGEIMSELDLYKNSELRKVAVVPSNSKSLRSTYFFTGASFFSFTIALSLFLFFHYQVFAILFAGLGIILWGVKNLVSKSLSLTSKISVLVTNEFNFQLRWERLRKEMGSCKFLEQVESEGIKAARQAEELLQQYKNMTGLLNQKFDPSEITYSRYQEAIDTTCLSIGENLLFIKGQLEALNLRKQNSESENSWTLKRIEVNEYLSKVDMALKQLDELFHSLNQITTKDNFRNELESSMERLKELAERAKKYSK